MCVFIFQDFTEEVNMAFEYLLKLTPLLDKADQRCKYEETFMLIYDRDLNYMHNYMRLYV